MPEHLFSLSQDPLLKYALLGTVSKFADAGLAVGRRLYLNLIGLSGSPALVHQLREIEDQYFEDELGPLANDPQERDFALDMGEPISHASMTRGTAQNIATTALDIAGTLLAISPEMLVFMGTRLSIDAMSNALYWSIKCWRSRMTKITF